MEVTILSVEERYVEKVVIDGVALTLSHPDSTRIEWVGQAETMERLMACWLTVSPKDQPLCPRLIGKPGIGKTTLAMAAARRLKQPLYIYQCTMDTRPEDLIVTPVLGENGKIHYHASPLVSAIIKGGICILDEGNRMSEKSWASVAPLLDHRRYVESILAGIKIEAHREFRCCVTMNDDASTYELPDYIMSRIQPTIELAFPPKEEELQILRYNIPFVEEDLLQKTVNFLQKAHGLDLDCSTRDGIHILRYSLKRLKSNPRLNRDRVWEEAINAVLGYSPKDAERLALKRKQYLGEKKFSDLAEFFMDPDYFSQDPNEKPGESQKRKQPAGKSDTLEKEWDIFKEHLDEEEDDENFEDEGHGNDRSDPLE